MNAKRFLVAVVLCFVVGGASLAVAEIMIPDATPRQDRVIEIDANTVTQIKSWYVDELGMRIDNLNAEFGELACDNSDNNFAKCAFSVESPILHTSLEIDKYKCVDLNVETNQCITYGEKDLAEKIKSQNEAYEAKLDEIKEATEMRLTALQTAAAGAATVTATEKK